MRCSQVKDLRVHYQTPIGRCHRREWGQSSTSIEGETLGLVGESGCGKSTLAMAILRLVQPPGRIVSGQVQIHGIDLIALNERELRQVRWSQIALIPQGAMNSLNPGHARQGSNRRGHRDPSGHEPRKSSKSVFSGCWPWSGCPAASTTMYPHELSGGMKQRVCIAMAIALTPSVIIADEPTSALDVVVQRVVAQTLLDVKRTLGVSMILIGHDMGLMAQLVDRIAVMYAGNIVEIAPVKDIFAEPLHPYTQLLLASIPSVKERKPLVVTEGLTHDLRHPPPGCIFQLRCPFVMDKCREVVPPLRELRPNHYAACHLY